MLIEITKVSPVRVEGKYQKMDITFAREGKENTRTLAGVGKTKEVIASLAHASPGENWEIGLEKTDDGKYWNWVSASKKEAPVAQAAAATKSSYQARSNYETPEERARRQVYIVRQSSVGSAIEYLTAQGKKYGLDEVLKTASVICSFVFSTDGAATVDEEAVKTGKVPNDDTFKDDIPF